MKADDSPQSRAQLPFHHNAKKNWWGWGVGGYCNGWEGRTLIRGLGKIKRGKKIERIN